jgi:3-methyl-2-oxobutanoate hydroxymethyltransferase
MSATIERKKITVPALAAMKQSREKIAALTAYDFLMARLLDEAGVDLILVGDSVAMVFAGHETTLPTTLEEIIYHTRAVRRGLRNALLVADMPFLSYQVSPEQAVLNAGRLLKEGGAEAVKLEGGGVMAETIRRIVQIGVPVMGHLGLTPQSIHVFGGYALQASQEESAKALLEEALLLQEAGVFALVLEKIPAKVAEQVTNALRIPTIGIGAGAACDGQILVTHDLLGLFEKFKPKFVRRYSELGRVMREAFGAYRQEVKEGKFPSQQESY